MNEFVYRFRTIDALLGDRQELAKQVVYFASLPQLNDPLEGFRDVVWQRDGILWRNLFRNFMRTFHAAHALAPIFYDVPTQEWMTGAVNVAFHTPDAPIKRELEEVAATFLESALVKRLADKLAEQARPIRRGELLFLLRMLHPFAMQVSAMTLLSNAKQSLLSINDEWIQQATTTLETLIDLPPPPPELAEELYNDNEVMSLQLQLINAASGVEHPPAALFLVADFAPHFVEAMIAMTYPDLYVASFVESPDNAAMWSAYADNHAGVCLKFRTRETEDHLRTLTLSSHRNWSWKQGGALEERRTFGPVVFSAVRYDTEFPEIPFFDSLGQQSIHHLNQHWHAEDGVMSPAADALKGEAEEWRNAYWRRFEGCINRKTPHWAHERELRLMLYSSLQPFDTIESRCINYQFEDLAGIVFGLRTSLADKVRILKVIEEKCIASGRADFELSQATHSNRTLDIETRPFKLIKFEDKRDPASSGSLKARTE